jgi:hypothetical protein
MAAAQSFTSGLDAKSLEAFSVACKKPFSEQAQFFLNAFWDEFNDQAECIYSIAWEAIKRADMRWRNVTYVHMYEEGNDLDFDMGQSPLPCPAQPDIPAGRASGTVTIRHCHATLATRHKARGTDEICGYMAHSIGGYECSTLTVFPRCLSVPLPFCLCCSS